MQRHAGDDLRPRKRPCRCRTRDRTSVQEVGIELVQNAHDEGVSFREKRREREGLLLQPVLGLGLQMCLLRHGKVMELRRY